MAPVTSLPTESDFDPHGGDLDAQCAWRNFGGLTVEKAKARFNEAPEVYQEDFMFMGTNAFVFYFPVLDDYLRNVPDQENDGDYQSWVISQCILAQFEADAIGRLRALVPAILDLARFVRDNVRRFGSDEAERQRVADGWVGLLHQIETVGEV
ncbi:MAG: hypothetical protein NTY19_18955 [Planctomycetota bacterium]|nr:hypothetical protein [Planctomycetota bacterium]